MIEDDVRAAFARHESLVPPAEDLTLGLAKAQRRRRSRRAVMRTSVSALAVAAVLSVPALAGLGDRPGIGSSSPVAGPAPARNLLLVGSDRQPGQPGSGRAEAIIIVHLAADGGKVYLLSLPAATLVPGGACGPHRDASLACSLASGGPSAEGAAVTRLTGLRFDAMVTFRYGGLATLVDALGGVDLTIDEEVRSADTNRVFRPGRVHLTGAQALDYVRQIPTPSDSTQFQRDLDLQGQVDRDRHQQQLLAAVVATAARRGVLTDPARLAAVLRGADSDSTVLAGGPNPNPAELASQFEQVRAGSLVGLSVPLIGVLANFDGRIGALPNLGAGADDLFGALARDRTAHFLAGHPELVWPLDQ